MMMIQVLMTLTVPLAFYYLLTKAQSSLTFTIVCIYMGTTLVGHLVSARYLPTYLSMYLSIYLSTYLPTYLPTYIPTYLPYSLHRVDWSPRVENRVLMIDHAMIFLMVSDWVDT